MIYNLLPDSENCHVALKSFLILHALVCVGHLPTGLHMMAPLLLSVAAFLSLSIS